MNVLEAGCGDEKLVGYLRTALEGVLANVTVRVCGFDATDYPRQGQRVRTASLGVSLPDRPRFGRQPRLLLASVGPVAVRGRMARYRSFQSGA